MSVARSLVRRAVAARVALPAVMLALGGGCGASSERLVPGSVAPATAGTAGPALPPARPAAPATASATAPLTAPPTAPPTQPAGAAAPRSVDSRSGRFAGGTMRGSPHPEVTAGRASDFNVLMIRRVVRRGWGVLRPCYEDPLFRDPTLRGVVTVTFTLDERGGVASAAAVPGEAGDARLDAVGACMARQIPRLSFSAPDGGAVSVTYRMVLQPVPPGERPTRRGGPFVPF